MNLLTTEQIIKIKEYCIEQAPKEACGYVYDDTIVFCKNVSEVPNTFELSEEDSLKIQQTQGAILWHSHTNGINHPSKQDLEMQLETDIPWAVLVLDSLNDQYFLKEIFYFGDCLKRDPLYERSYRFGVTDCANFVLDYYQENGIKFPAYPRDMDEWLAGAYSYEDYFTKPGFKVVGNCLKDAKEGDLLLFNIRAKFPNHAGIYLGNGIFGHHLQNRVSKKEPVEPWSRYLVKVMRHGS